MVIFVFCVYLWLYLRCCPLLCCLILVVSVYRVLEKFECQSFCLYCQPVPTWSEVHAMTSTTENTSLQESQTGDSLTVDPTVVHSEVANASDEFEFDIGDLTDQFGIDHITQSLNALNEKLVGLSGVASLPQSGNTAAKSDAVDSVFFHDSVFDSTVVILTEQTSAPTLGADSSKQLDSSVFLPSVFEEKESFGSDVADVIAH